MTRTCNKETLGLVMGLDNSRRMPWCNDPKCDHCRSKEKGFSKLMSQHNGLSYAQAIEKMGFGK